MENTNNILIDDLQLLDEGFIQTCMAVARSYGAEGKLSLIENLQHDLPPNLTKDGWSICERIRFKDKVKNFGALQAIQASARTLNLAGDSTTACLLFAMGFLQGIKREDFNKAVERGIEMGTKEVLSAIIDLATPVNREVLRKVAITSANNDEALGTLIMQAYDQVGYDSIVKLQKNYSTTKNEVISQNGMKIDKGFSSPFFINNQHKATWEAKDVLVVALETWQGDENITNFIRANRRKNDDSLQPILFVMEKENGDFKQSLIDFIQAGHVDACLVIGMDSHSEFKCSTNLKDIALFTDGVSYHPNHVEIVAGYADSVTVTSEKTYIVRDSVSEGVTKRIEELKAKELDATDEFTKERIQRLEGKSVLISIGGSSVNDCDETYDRADDALRAVKTAIPLGVIAGGGSTLVYISERMKQEFPNKDEQIGYNLVKAVMLNPFNQLLKNANRDKVAEEKKYIAFAKDKYGVGYNAKTDQISNLFEDGVLDSAKSISIALQSGKEAAVKMLLTSVIVTIP